MIIWLNGGFGAGKTTLAAELHRRVPEAIVYDPEDVGRMLWRWMPPNDDFQDLASWRELVVATALSLRRHHAATLIVPMSLINEAYRTEIFAGLAAGGADVLHVFLRADGDVLRQRVTARIPPPGAPTDGSLLRWALARVDAALLAAGQLPQTALILRSDRLSPTQLADAVLTATNPDRA